MERVGTFKTCQQLRDEMLRAGTAMIRTGSGVDTLAYLEARQAYELSLEEYERFCRARDPDDVRDEAKDIERELRHASE